MSDPFEIIATLKQRYPEDLAEIAAEEQRLSELIEMQDYADHPVTKKLLSAARKEVVTARRRLATDRTLVDDERAQRALWHIVDSRMWFISLAGRDFEGEKRLIQQMLEEELNH